MIYVSYDTTSKILNSVFSAITLLIYITDQKFFADPEKLSTINRHVYGTDMVPSVLSLLSIRHVSRAQLFTGIQERQHRTDP